MIYFVPSNPASPPVTLPCLRSRARRAGYRVAADRYAPTFSLVDARLRRPLLGLDHVGLNDIARAVEVIQATRPINARVRRRRPGLDHEDLREIEVVRLTPAKPLNRNLSGDVA